MNPFRTKRQRGTTSFVRLDTHKCQACWKCTDECNSHVLGRINLPWHKHAVLSNPASCTGCLKCIKTCDYGAFSKTA